MTMSARLQRQLRALVIAAAPVVLLAGAVTHPYLGNRPGIGSIAHAVATEPDRWALGHLVLGVGIASALLLFFALRMHLHDHGENLWSFWSAPVVTVGLALSGFMVGAEGFGGRGAAATGRVPQFMDALMAWAVPVYGGANLLIACGLVGFATAVAKSGLLPRSPTWLVFAGAVIAAVALFLPFGWAAHLVAAGLGVFAWPIALQIWPTMHRATEVTGSHAMNPR